MDLKPYICECCGGRIDLTKMKCEYCDTPYRNESLKDIRFIQVRPGEHTIRAEVAVNYDDMKFDPEGVRNYTLHELRNQLADGLLDFMKIETSEGYDRGLFERTQIIRGEVRVVDPVFDRYR